MLKKKRKDYTVSFSTIDKLDEMKTGYKSRSEIIDKAVELLWKKEKRI